MNKCLNRYTVILKLLDPSANEDEDEDEILTNLPGFTEEMLSFEVFIKEEEIDKIELLYLK